MRWGRWLTPTRFQSTLPVKGATSPTTAYQSPTTVSIHAPGEGSDKLYEHLFILSTLFQSTLPVKGATLCGLSIHHFLTLFQSTLPVKGATLYEHLFILSTLFQSTLPVKGATQSRRKTS